MALLHRKSKWQRAVRPVTDRVDGKGLARSGLTTVATAVSLTAASAVVSAVRRKGRA